MPYVAQHTPLEAEERPARDSQFAYGGQALMEGVLMRGRNAIAVALRHPDGRIVTAPAHLDSRIHTSNVGKWPLIRGLVVLYETLVVGTRWLVRSVSVQAEEDVVELGRARARDAPSFGVAIVIFSCCRSCSSVATSGSTRLARA